MIQLLGLLGLWGLWGLWGTMGTVGTMEAMMALYLGNLACIWVFSGKSVDLKPSFANILKCLSIYDICLLVSLHTHFSFPNPLFSIQLLTRD